MTIAEKLTKIYENTQKVYDAGVEAGKSQGGQTTSELWDSIQDFGNRTNYQSVFRYWAGAKYITPKYPIITSSAYEIFCGCSSLLELPPIQFTAESNTFYAAFNSCKVLKEINMDIRPTNVSSSMTQTFFMCQALQTINKIIVTEDVKFTNTFKWCSELVDVTFEGTIGNSIDFGHSSKLSKECILHIFDHLADKTGTSGFVVTLGATNLAKLTDTEKAIATGKGWTLA